VAKLGAQYGLVEVDATRNGILGESRVNVLKLNLALDRTAPVKK
jgi:K+-transporting ATPase c subunit